MSRYQKFIRKQGSWNHGEIVPVGAPLEVIPGEYYVIDLYSVIRMATPIAPIMDDIDMDVYAFFTPFTLIANGQGSSAAVGPNQNMWEKIIGNGTGNPTDWTATSTEIYQVPTLTYKPNTAKTSQFTSVGEALGLGVNSNTTSLQINAMPLYNYNLIYQDFFRNENVEAQKTNLNLVSNVHGADSTSPTGTATDYNHYDYNQCLSVGYKKLDPYTSAVPNPTKGPSIELPLGEKASIVASGTEGLSTGTLYSLGAYNATAGNDINLDPGLKYLDADNAAIATGNLYADLSTATAATINQFIYAYNVQRLLMTDIKGTRYYELLQNHFGVTNPDLVLHRPQYLGGKTFRININQVVQQAGAESTTSGTSQENILGTTGAYSLTNDKAHLVSGKFNEYGYIQILAICRHKRTYSNGIPKLYERSTRFDYFWKELAGIGYQSINKSRLYAGTDGVYGYEPAWEELRRMGDDASFGFLNPSKDNALDYWTLAEDLTSAPTLSMSFLKEDREELKRALTVTDGPDYIGNFVIAVKKDSPVPANTLPRLVV